MGYYVMLDSPSIKTESRKVKHLNKPRKEHLTKESAITEAHRLVKKTGFRAVVLEVIYTVPSPNEKVLILPHSN